VKRVSAPVVLVHGVGLDHHLWDGVRFRLGLPRPTHAYDTVGHGDGPHRPSPYRLADYVEQLATEIDTAYPVREARARQPVDIVGFSMGALVAQGFALAHAKRVRRLVLVATVFDRPPAERAAVLARVADVRSGGYERSVALAIERWFSPAFAAAHGDVVDAVRARMTANDVRAYADAYEVFATADAELAPSVAAITAPTLVIAGGDDARSTPAMAEALATALPNGRAVVLPAVRHGVMLEAPDEFARLVGEFLDEEDQP
jgi:(E)-2-((N-methylformamido)methylene)succinate hydrolase